MLSETLARLEAAIAKIPTKDARSRERLAELVAQLKAEISVLTKTHDREARAVASLAEAAALAAAGPGRADLDVSVKGLAASVKDFEVSHPKLVARVNDVCLFLSELGI